MSEEKDIYFKQVKMFNPTEHNLKVFVYGAGSIGSHVVVGLAKIGVKDITVYDFDEVEEDNFPAQFFPHLQTIDTTGGILKEVSVTDLPNKSKLRVLNDLTHQMTRTTFNEVHGKIDTSFKPNISMNSIHILAFDNIEARKIVLSKLDGFPVHIIDGRIGKFNYEKYYMYGMNVPEEYKKTLEGVFSELECGEKCLWSVNSLISSKILADVIKISKGDKPVYMLLGNAMSDNVVVKDEV